MRDVILGCDTGEAIDPRGRQIENELFETVDAVSIACGGHAGDATSMSRTVQLAIEHGCLIGAHPSYPDREGFGRRQIDISSEALERSISHQLLALSEVARSLNSTVSFVKAHGALYHSLSNQPDLAIGFWSWCDRLFAGSKIVMPLGCASLSSLKAEGVPLLIEGFCDRAYGPEGLLRPRSERGAMIIDPEQAADQAQRLAEDLKCDLLCIHSDTRNAIDIALAVRARIDSH